MTRSANRANIETLIAWLDAMRRKDLEAAIAFFAPDVVWEGLVPGVECSDRDDVREMLGQRVHDNMDVEHLEVLGGSDGAVLGIRSGELDELAGVKLNGQLFNVFTIRHDRIVHVRDFASRTQAEEAAGIGVHPG